MSGIFPQLLPYNPVEAGAAPAETMWTKTNWRIFVATMFVLLVLLGAATVGLSAGFGATIKSQEDKETNVKCLPARPTGAPWLYQDPATCMETVRFGIYSNVSDANQYLVNNTLLAEYFALYKPWLDENFAPVWGRTASFEIFTGAHLPPGNDWSPYAMLFVNDLNAVQLGACGFHSFQNPMFGSGSKDIIGEWAPESPPSWPYASVPLGTNPPAGNDGVWNCQISRTTIYGWNLAYWQNYEVALAHEIEELMIDPSSYGLQVANNLETLFTPAFSFFFQEVADPFEYNVPLFIGDTDHVVPNFAYPSFFTGCIDDACSSSPPPYDFQGLTESPLMPHNGNTEYIRYNLTDGALLDCSTLQKDIANGGLPYTVCDVVWVPAEGASHSLPTPAEIAAIASPFRIYGAGGD
jgi:hypothetical protein